MLLELNTKIIQNDFAAHNFDLICF